MGIASKHVRWHVVITVGMAAFGLIAFLNLAWQFADNSNPVKVGAPDNVIVPNTGIEGWKALEFCKDPKTEVQAFNSPDASGITYQMMRVRDGVPESATFVYSPTGQMVIGKHYFNVEVSPGHYEQRSEDAIVSRENLVACIAGKQ